MTCLAHLWLGIIAGNLAQCCVSGFGPIGMPPPTGPAVLFATGPCEITIPPPTLPPPKHHRCRRKPAPAPQPTILGGTLEIYDTNGYLQIMLGEDTGVGCAIIGTGPSICGDGDPPPPDVVGGTCPDGRTFAFTRVN